MRQTKQAATTTQPLTNEKGLDNDKQYVEVMTNETKKY